jgi:hypothetical protein
MATVEQVFAPEEARFLSTTFPQMTNVLGTNFPVSGLSYDSTADEFAYWKWQAINYGSGNITLNLYWYSDSGTSGDVVWDAAIAAITANTDSQDVETKAFATVNSVTDSHLGTTAQRVHLCTITISNLDSVAADDICWLRISRDANNGSDTLNGIDVILLWAHMTYSDS